VWQRSLGAFAPAKHLNKRLRDVTTEAELEDSGRWVRPHRK